ncbi:MAG: copper ion binding protein [Thermomicrobiales bacterium]
MNSTIQQITLTAPDISCGHCVATVLGAVGALDGVRSVLADAETKQVAIAFDQSRVSLPQIEAALDDAGYPVAK